MKKRRMRRKNETYAELLLRMSKGLSNGCLIWKGCCYNKDPKSYGVIRFMGQRIGVHRLAAFLWKGVPIAKNREFVIRHLCNNRKCINPQHLVKGSYKDNYEDARKMGRHSHGSKHGNAVLNEKIVREIRKKYKQGYGYMNLLRDYRLAGTTLKNVLANRTWKHVASGACGKPNFRH